jgi:asparagine synthase (glutamine-hydrolysing)
LPGIAGIVDLKGLSNSEEKMGSMLAVMKHEPWYVLDFDHQAPVTLGRCSPGIIDPLPQPVFNHDRSSCLVMYGEVYGYPGNAPAVPENASPPPAKNHALSTLNLIDERGIQAVSNLNGSFALALWDSRSRTLTLANDRFGLRPLYYHCRDDLFLFASEMKAILACLATKPKLDLQSLAQFLGLGAVLEDRTPFDEIKILSPASILTFCDNTLRKESYWALESECKGGGEHTRERIQVASQLLEQAIHRQLGDDLPKVLSLSGGLDSRTILGASASLGYGIPTFTFGIDGCSDQILAKRAADAAGVENRFFELSPDFLGTWAGHGVWLTEGMNSCANFHGIEFTPEIHKTASVVINGFMGGELFGFVSTTAARLLFARKSGPWIGKLFRHVNHPFPESELRLVMRTELYRHIEGSCLETLKKLLRNSPFDSPFDKYYHFRFGAMAPKLFLYGLLLDNDLVEYRIPFADYELVDFVSRLSPRQKALAAFHRRLLTQTYPRLAALPYQRTGLPVSSGSGRILLGKLQEKILHRAGDRRKYTDYDGWMRRELREFVCSALLSERFLGRGYFNPDRVKALMEQHMSGKRNLGLQLCALLTFELWSQLFVDRTPGSET